MEKMNSYVYGIDKTFVTDDQQTINYTEFHLVVAGEDFVIAPKFKDDKRYFRRVISGLAVK